MINDIFKMMVYIQFLMVMINITKATAAAQYHSNRQTLLGTHSTGG